MEAAPRLHRSAHDHELGAPLGRDAGDLLPEAQRARADDLLPHADAVGGGDRGRGLEPVLERPELAVEARVERELELDDERGHEDEASSAIGRHPAGQIDRVLRLLPREQRDDDAPVRDRAGPPGHASRAAAQRSDVRMLHRRSWYGTDARITWGSNSRSRFT